MYWFSCIASVKCCYINQFCCNIEKGNYSIFNFKLKTLSLKIKEKVSKLTYPMLHHYLMMRHIMNVRVGIKYSK